MILAVSVSEPVQAVSPLHESFTAALPLATDAVDEARLSTPGGGGWHDAGFTTH